jgi:hypothetical protein
MATEIEEAPASTEASAAPAPAPPLEPPKPDKKAAKAKGAKKDGKAEEGKKAKKGKKGDGDGEDAEPDAGGPSVAAHPRARRAVARAKGWGGLVGFMLGGYLSLPTNTLATAGLRALIAGVVCYIAAWAGAVFIWRRLVMLELKGREQQLLSAAQARVARRALPAAPPERPRARAS